MKTRRGFCSAALAVLAGVWCAPALRAESLNFLPDPQGKLPLLALWVDDHGSKQRTSPGEKVLRFAVWEDGTVLCGRDLENDGNRLRTGKIPKEQVALLKKQIQISGIFELKGNCYLVPDAPVHCMIAVVDGKQQMLFWDEREIPGYGINSNPKPQHLAFIRAWKQAKAAGIKQLGGSLTDLAGVQTFRPPDAWYLKKPIQSE